MCKQWDKTDEVNLTGEHKVLFDVSKIWFIAENTVEYVKKAELIFHNRTECAINIQFNNIQQVFSVLRIYVLKTFSSADFGVQTTNLFLNLIY